MSRKPSRAVLAVVRHLQAAGVRSPEGIARALVVQEFPPPRRGAVWTARCVATLLRWIAEDDWEIAMRAPLRPFSALEDACEVHRLRFGHGPGTWRLTDRGRDDELAQAILDAVRAGEEFDAVAFRKRWGWCETPPGADG
jgi:hypothetical protein